MPKSFLNMAGYPLGLRNNNPGNIRPFDPWQGMIGENKGFAVFQDISWGLRAMGKAIIHEFNVGNNTVSRLINEWAPPSDGNDTGAYIASVSSFTGFPSTAILTANTDTLVKLIRAMMRVELGANFAAKITDNDILEGLALIGDGQVSPGAVKTAFGVSGILFLTSVFFAGKAVVKSVRLKRRIKRS